jgi:hypothetical protein
MNFREKPFRSPSMAADFTDMFVGRGYLGSTIARGDGISNIRIVETGFF